MRIPVHHGDDGKAHTDFRSRYHHDEKNKDLSVDTRIWIREHRRRVMHFRKSDEQQIHGIQHQFDAHEYDNGIAAGQYTGDTDAEQGDGQENIVIDWHNPF